MVMGRTVDLEWPQDRRFYLTLDLECDYGTALPENTYEAVEAVDRLASLLERMEMPLTCFVQTELLEEHPTAVEPLTRLSESTLFPHSHTHQPRSATDMDAEIATSTSRYEAHFDSSPAGYRLPNGNIRPADYSSLADHGYSFDASLFPSWRPRKFDNRNAPTTPFYLPEYDIIEVPFTVLSDRLRIPTALSYYRLVGRPYSWLLNVRSPRPLIFNIHMHDLVTPSSYRELPRRYRLVYGKNDHGFDILERVLERFRDDDYTFGTIDELTRDMRDQV
jgi:peptidoglycan/xylan/chitin deacetylase (PgdA/CDA1 family)